MPGRAAVDCITSWIGDGTLGVMLTCNQYEGGLILESKLPINLPELFFIFLERTILSLLIVCPIAHLLF